MPFRMWTSNRRWFLAGVLAAIVTWPAAVRAQQDGEREVPDALPPVPDPDYPDSESDEKPWNRGVPRERRVRARAIFRDGYRLLQIPSFARAARRFERALALWQHPAFHYNLAIAQLNLVRPIDAYRSFSLALRHGEAPLGQPKHAQALAYLAGLERQVARVEILCDDPNADVTVDGRPVPVQSGTREAVVMPGEHQVVAASPGKQTATETVAPAAGERVVVELVLRDPRRLVTARYLPAWVSWATLGVGVATLSAAGYLDWRSSRALHDFDRRFDALCPLRGCTEDEAPELAAQHRGVERDKRIALGLYIAGGVAVAGSAVLFLLDRERIVAPEAPEAPDDDGLALIPVASPRWLGAIARMRF